MPIHAGIFPLNGSCIGCTKFTHKWHNLAQTFSKYPRFSIVKMRVSHLWDSSCIWAVLYLLTYVELTDVVSILTWTKFPATQGYALTVAEKYCNHSAFLEKLICCFCPQGPKSSRIYSAVIIIKVTKYIHIKRHKHYDYLYQELDFLLIQSKEDSEYSQNICWTILLRQPHRLWYETELILIRLLWL